MQLIYMYVQNYRNRGSSKDVIKCTDFNFSDQFKVSYDKKEKTISVKENVEKLDDDFYHKSITSIKAFVGENGSGKTTVLDLIGMTRGDRFKDHLKDGFNSDDGFTSEYFLVYSLGDDLFLIEEYYDKGYIYEKQEKTKGMFSRVPKSKRIYENRLFLNNDIEQWDDRNPHGSIDYRDGMSIIYSYDRNENMFKYKDSWNLNGGILNSKNIGIDSFKIHYLSSDFSHRHSETSISSRLLSESHSIKRTLKLMKFGDRDANDFIEIINRFNNDSIFEKIIKTNADISLRFDFDKIDLPDEVYKNASNDIKKIQSILKKSQELYNNKERYLDDFLNRDIQDSINSMIGLYKENKRFFDSGGDIIENIDEIENLEVNSFETVIKTIIEVLEKSTGHIAAFKEKEINKVNLKKFITRINFDYSRIIPYKNVPYNRKEVLDDYNTYMSSWSEVYEKLTDLDENIFEDVDGEFIRFKCQYSYYTDDSMTSIKKLINCIQEQHDKSRENYVFSSAIKFNFDKLSSGEKILLIILSKIYNSVEANRSAHNIILIDEPDCRLHPEWSRIFWFEIINIIYRLEKYYKNLSLQFIISSHSPFLISDLRKDDVILCKKSEDRSIMFEYNKSSINTFGANINDLLIKDFFMRSSIGEFAKGKIIKVIDKLDRNNDLDYCEKIIDIVGDEIVKIRLKDKLAKAKNNEANKKIQVINKMSELSLNELKKIENYLKEIQDDKNT